MRRATAVETVAGEEDAAVLLESSDESRYILWVRERNSIQLMRKHCGEYFAEYRSVFCPKYILRAYCNIYP